MQWATEGICPLAVAAPFGSSTGFASRLVEHSIYAFLNFLQTDVSATVEGEDSSVSGEPLDGGGGTASFVTLVATEADDPPLINMPPPVLDGLTFRDAGPNQNLRYEVSINDAMVPTDPTKPLLYRAEIRFETEYRAGSVTQELWIVSPPS